MTGGLLARAALLAVALAALACVGLGLRAVILTERGVAKLEAAQGDDGPDAATAAEADDLFRRASRANADPAPELERAVLLIGQDRGREAAALLEEVVRDNPGHVRAWGLLATATARFDDRRSTRASGELLTLYGRVQGEPLPRGVLRSSSGRRYVIVPGSVLGRVDVSSIEGGRVTFKGWATGVQRDGPAEVLVVSRGRVVATAVASRSRPDIARRLGGPAFGRSGFSFSIPLAAIAGEREGEPDVHLLGATRGEASPLAFVCGTGQQDVGC